MGGDPFSRRALAAYASVSPLLERAVVVMVAAGASRGKNGPTMKRIDQQSVSCGDRLRLRNGQVVGMLNDRLGVVLVRSVSR